MGTATLVVALVIGAVTSVARPALAAAVSPGTFPGSAGALRVSAEDGESLQRQVSHLGRHILNGSHKVPVLLMRLFQDMAAWWRGWLQAALFYLGVAGIAVLADRGLVNAWRADGLRSAALHSALMLYVYACLLFSGGVTLAPKLFFVGALLYGVWQQDLVPNSQVEDILLIIVAARAFIYACPDSLLNEYAARAVAFRRRVDAAQRSR